MDLLYLVLLLAFVVMTVFLIIRKVSSKTIESKWMKIYFGLYLFTTVIFSSLNTTSVIEAISIMTYAMRFVFLGILIYKIIGTDNNYNKWFISWIFLNIVSFLTDLFEFEEYGVWGNLFDLGIMLLIQLTILMFVLFNKRHDFGEKISKMNFILLCITSGIFIIMPPSDIETIISGLVIIPIVLVLPVWIVYKKYQKIYHFEEDLEQVVNTK